MSAPRIAPVDPPYPPALQADFDKLMRGRSRHGFRLDDPHLKRNTVIFLSGVRPSHTCTVRAS